MFQVIKLLLINFFNGLRFLSFSSSNNSFKFFIRFILIFLRIKNSLRAPHLIIYFRIQLVFCPKRIVTMRSIVVNPTYSLCCARMWMFPILGCMGCHRCYLGDTRMGLCRLFSLGGCIFGYLYDCCYLDSLVSEANAKFSTSIILNHRDHVSSQPLINKMEKYTPPTHIDTPPTQPVINKYPPSGVDFN